MDTSSETDQENNNCPVLDTSHHRKMVYRELLNKVEGIEQSENLGLQEVQEIGNVIKQVNVIEREHNISQRYQHTDETLLDSKLLSSVSDILLNCAKVVDVNSANYTSTDFADKIKLFLTDEEFESENILKLLLEAQKIIPQIPKSNSIFGTYDLEVLPKPKQKKERQKTQKEKFEKKEPEKVQNLEKEDTGIDEILKVFHAVLKTCYEKNNNQPINYFDYVIDTSCFTKTVENVFYCSFLVRDGKAHITIDNRGTPFIKPMSKSALKDYRGEGGVNSQIITSISMSDWEQFKNEGYIQKYYKTRK